jgi:hypothetical protein
MRRIPLVVVDVRELEASPDGQRWTELDTGSGDWLSVPSGLSARSLRVSGELDSIDRFREISIWS